LLISGPLRSYTSQRLSIDVEEGLSLPFPVWTSLEFTATIFHFSSLDVPVILTATGEGIAWLRSPEEVAGPERDRAPEIFSADGLTPSLSSRRVFLVRHGIPFIVPLKDARSPPHPTLGDNDYAYLVLFRIVCYQSSDLLPLQKPTPCMFFSVLPPGLQSVSISFRVLAGSLPVIPLTSSNEWFLF